MPRFKKWAICGGILGAVFFSHDKLAGAMIGAVAGGGLGMAYDKWLGENARTLVRILLGMMAGALLSLAALGGLIGALLGLGIGLVFGALSGGFLLWWSAAWGAAGGAVLGAGISLGGLSLAELLAESGLKILVMAAIGSVMGWKLSEVGQRLGRKGMWKTLGGAGILGAIVGAFFGDAIVGAVVASSLALATDPQ